MDIIEVKPIKTCYDYFEYYWVINDIPIVYYLENHKSDTLSQYGSLLGLMPAWNGKLNWEWENAFVWEMAADPKTVNVPILVCEDDCDLSCIVVMAQVRRTENTIYWDKLGILNNKNINIREYNKSGILYLEAYSDEDWEKYGDNIATETYDSPQYWEWVEQNCYEENIRRLRNYLKPYMQNDENTAWIWRPKWEFTIEEYEKMIRQYEKIRISQPI